MSGYVMGLTLKHSTMEGAARLVMVAIADAAAHDGTWASPTVAEIAQRAAISERTVCRCIRKCQEAGELIVEKNAGNADDPRYRPNRYSIPLSTWIMAEAYEVRDSQRSPRATLRGVADVTPYELRGVADVTPNLPGETSISTGTSLDGTKATLRGVADVTPKVLIGAANVTPEAPISADSAELALAPIAREPTREHLESKPKSKPKTKPTPRTYTRLFASISSDDAACTPEAPLEDTFAVFWSSYPARHGKRVGRRAAEVIWLKLRPADQAAAAAAVENYRQACDDDLVFAKDAHRWLRDRCWDDWATPAKPKRRSNGDPLANRHELSLDELLTIAANGSPKAPRTPPKALKASAGRSGSDGGIRGLVAPHTATTKEA